MAPPCLSPSALPDPRGGAGYRGRARDRRVAATTATQSHARSRRAARRA